MRSPDFWHGRGLTARLLAPLGVLYGASVRLKARRTRAYDAGIAVICVGNLTAGGSGKTPVALALAEMLRQRGRKVFFLTRGYGGREKGPALVSAADSAARMGDEALLLARAAPTIKARNRVAGAALAAMRGADVLVMDDGHQNFTLRKSLSLVVVDAQSGFGNGLMIPAGPLREPVNQGLSRADAVVLVGDGAPDLRGFGGPVLRARLVAEGAAFAGTPVFAFAGIGRPEKFIASLQGSGALITGSRFFNDHHPYTDDDIRKLKALAGDALLVTTQKDYVRLTPAMREGIKTLAVTAVFEDQAALARLLDIAMPGG